MTQGISAVIWDYFKITEADLSKVKCNSCDKVISRGGKDPSGFGHKGMKKHLKTHVIQNTEYNARLKNEAKAKIKAQENKRKLEEETRLSQTKLEAAFVKQWGIDHPVSAELIKKIAEFICLDQQPLSVVEDEGFLRLLNFLQPKFKCPSRRHFSDVILPNMYSSVKEKIDGILADQTHISFTCDIWSSRSNESYCSLTCHYISEDFRQKEATLACSYSPEDHTGENVGAKVIKMLKEAKVYEKLHLVVRDSGTNMISGLRGVNIPSVPCLAHMIQNIIHEGLLKGEQSINRLINAAKKLVGHFKHSPKATERFKNIQKSLMPVEKQHNLLQSEPTRWNTEYYMLERLIEQKVPILAALTEENESKVYLREDQWELAKHVVELLAPFEAATRKMCLQSASISQMIPFIETIKVSLQRSIEDNYLLTAKQKMIEGLKTRAEKILIDENCYIATALDPRYKFRLFSENDRFAAKMKLVQHISAYFASNSCAADQSDQSADEGCSKRKRKKATHMAEFDGLMSMSVT